MFLIFILIAIIAILAGVKVWIALVAVALGFLALAFIGNAGKNLK